MKYDYLIVGSGLFGATFANLAKKDGKKVLVIEKRPLLEIFILKKLKEYKYIDMELIFFTQIIKKCGIMLIHL